jgi:mRNA interferase MazF
LVISRGDIHWAELGDADGSRPANRRPVLVIQSASYNASRLSTVVTAVITSNTAQASMPGNVFLPSSVTGLPRDSVVNVTAIVTLKKDDLDRAVGHVPDHVMQDVEQGLRQVLAL